MSKTSEEMRTVWAKYDAMRDEGLEVPSTIRRYDDLSYGADPVWNRLDVYCPKTAETKKLPVIINVHGGGWVYGDKKLYQYYCMNLAEREFAVINYSYRLAPENRFPAYLEDSVLAIQWIFSHAEEYLLDTSNIFMVGDSAGAQIVGQICALAGNEEFAKQFRFCLPKEFKPRAIAMNCGVYHLYDSRMKCFDSSVNPDLISDLFEDGGTPEEMKLMNVVDLVNHNFPPAYIATALGDSQLAQAVWLKKAYEEAGLDYTYDVYGTVKNPLFHIFMVNLKNPESKVCNDKECDFFRKYLY